jgi:putative phosphoesterase
MKTVIFSDIHGNVVALEAVLKDLEQQGGADQIIIPGDIFAFGPAPYETLMIVRELGNTHFLLGNTDRYLLQGTYPSTLTDDGWQSRLLYSFHWTAERLGVGGLDFLKTLPSFQRVSAGQQQLLAVHGSPRSDEEGLTSKTTLEDLEAMAIAPEVSILVSGHTHMPMDRMFGRVRVLNAGSVGLPFDGDPRACYVIISNFPAEADRPTQVEFRRVAYDVEQVVDQFYEANYPAAEISAYNVRTARSMGSSPIYTAEMRRQKANQPILTQTLKLLERI